MGVLILGSGNISHNLRLINMGINNYEPSTDWAKSLDETIKSALISQDHQKLINYRTIPGSAQGIATPDHYYPFLYTLGASQGTTNIKQIYEGFELGTLSMRCVQWL